MAASLFVLTAQVFQLSYNVGEIAFSFVWIRPQLLQIRYDKLARQYIVPDNRCGRMCCSAGVQVHWKVWT